MKRYSTAWMMSILALCGMVSVALAADYTGSKTSTTATPQIETAEGSLSGVDLLNNGLKVTDSKGKVWNLAVDPKTTTAWKGNQPLTLAQLKMGDQVKVRCTSINGKQICKSIEVSQPPAAVPPTASTTGQ